MRLSARYHPSTGPKGSPTQGQSGGAGRRRGPRSAAGAAGDGGPRGADGDGGAGPPPDAAAVHLGQGPARHAGARATTDLQRNAVVKCLVFLGLRVLWRWSWASGFPCGLTCGDAMARRCSAGAVRGTAQGHVSTEGAQHGVCPGMLWPMCCLTRGGAEA